MFSYDEYGRFEILATTYYEEDGVTIEYRKYGNNSRTKAAGGMYCLYCIETGKRIFRRNDHVCMLSLSKFIENNKD